MKGVATLKPNVSCVGGKAMACHAEEWAVDNFGLVESIQQRE